MQKLALGQMGVDHHLPRGPGLRVGKRLQPGGIEMGADALRRNPNIEFQDIVQRSARRRQYCFQIHEHGARLGERIGRYASPCIAARYHAGSDPIVQAACRRDRILVAETIDEDGLAPRHLGRAM